MAVNFCAKILTQPPSCEQWNHNIFHLNSWKMPKSFREEKQNNMNYILFFKSCFPLCHSQTVCLHVNVRSQNYWSSVDLIMWHCLMLPPLVFFTTAYVQIVHWILYGILIYLLILTIFFVLWKENVPSQAPFTSFAAGVFFFSFLILNCNLFWVFNESKLSGRRGEIFISWNESQLKIHLPVICNA